MTTEGMLVLVTASLAVISDLKTGKIRNGLLLCGFAAAVTIHMISRDSIWLWLGGTLVPLVFGICLYHLHMVGAGDLKLLAVLGAMMGLPVFWYFLFIVLCFGGALSLAMILGITGIRSRSSYLVRYAEAWLAGDHSRSYRIGSVERPENFHFTIPILMAAILYAGGLLG